MAIYGKGELEFIFSTGGGGIVTIKPYATMSETPKLTYSDLNVYLTETNNFLQILSLKKTIPLWSLMDSHMSSSRV